MKFSAVSIVVWGIDDLSVMRKAVKKRNGQKCSRSVQDVAERRQQRSETLCHAG